MCELSVARRRGVALEGRPEEEVELMFIVVGDEGVGWWRSFWTKRREPVREA